MRPLLACLLSLALGAQAAPVDMTRAPAPAPDDPIPPARPLPLRMKLDKETIRTAIAATPPEKDPYPRRHEVDTISATPHETFSNEFAAARLPDCLHSDGLRNQPTFFLSGLLALPFIAVAKLRGVCR